MMRRLLRRQSSTAPKATESLPLQPLSPTVSDHGPIERPSPASSTSSTYAKGEHASTVNPSSFLKDKECIGNSAAAAASPDPLPILPTTGSSGVTDERLREALREHDGLNKTVQAFFKQIKKQAAQIEAYEGLLRELSVQEGEEVVGEWQEPPNLWGEDHSEGEQHDHTEEVVPPLPSQPTEVTLSRSSSVCTAVASARVTAQIIEVCMEMQKIIRTDKDDGI